MDNKNFRYDIAMLRLTCIVVVVFFHAYGMMYANHFPEHIASVYREYYKALNDTYMINIAMPMFVFVSGFLFGGQLIREEQVSFSKVLKSKFNRLMVPFFLFSVVFMITQNSTSIKPFYQWTYSHLWFLPMLFWCFILFWLMKPLIMNKSNLISLSTLCFLFLISLPGRVFPMILGLHNVNIWFCWFALGTWFFKHEVNLLPKSNFIKIISIVVGLSVYVGLMMFRPQLYGQHTVVGIVSSISALYSLWILFAWIPWRNYKLTAFLLVLSSCSFGIYIFHNWIEAFMVSSAAQRMLNLQEHAEKHVIIFPFLFSIVAYFLSFAITRLMLKFSIGQKLLR